MVKTEIVNITPEIAKEYLRHNVCNRKIKHFVVDTYARDIARGEFVTTHQGIGFNEAGDLCDGQHRLLAIIKANKPVSMVVTTGLPMNAIECVDRGSGRSIKDVITISANEDFDNSIAAALNNRKILSGLNQLVNCNYGRRKLSVSDVKRLYEAMPDAVDKAFAIVSSKAGCKAYAPMVAAGIAALAFGESAFAVTKFFDVFFTDDVVNCEGYGVVAALNWKRQIDKTRINHSAMNKKSMYLGTQNAIFHFCGNTGITQVKIPETPRYDAKDIIAVALD